MVCICTVAGTTSTATYFYLDYLITLSCIVAAMLMCMAVEEPSLRIVLLCTAILTKNVKCMTFSLLHIQ